MESKVISVRVGSDLFNKINKVASRYYPKSYTGQPNRSELFLAALRLFCDLADSGVFENVNMESLSASSIVNSVDSFVDSVDSQRQLLEALKNELLPEIEKLLEKQHKERSYTESTIKDAKIDSFVDSVYEQDTMSLDEALKLAKERGFTGNKKTFSSKFTKNKDNPNYRFHRIGRIVQGTGKSAIFFDTVNETKLN